MTCTNCHRNKIPGKPHMCEAAGAPVTDRETAERIAAALLDRGVLTDDGDARAIVEVLAARREAAPAAAWRSESPTEPGCYPWRAKPHSTPDIVRLDSDGLMVFHGSEVEYDPAIEGGEWGPRIVLDASPPTPGLVEAALLREWRDAMHAANAADAAHLEGESTSMGTLARAVNAARTADKVSKRLLDAIDAALPDDKEPTP